MTSRTARSRAAPRRRGRGCGARSRSSSDAGPARRSRPRAARSPRCSRRWPRRSPRSVAVAGSERRPTPTPSRRRSRTSTPPSTCTAYSAARPPSRRPRPSTPTVTEAYDAHRARRDLLIALIESAGREPVAAEAGYDLPADLSTPTAVSAGALELERACAATYAGAVACTTASDRAWAIDVLLDTTQRSASSGLPGQLPRRSPEPASTRTAEANRARWHTSLRLRLRETPERPRSSGSRPL